jgi:hypothetical protein
VPAAGAQHPPHLPHRLSRIEHEHQPLAAQHHVVRAVRLVDPLQVELASQHVGDACRIRARGGDRGHLRHHVGEHHLPTGSHELGRRQADGARAACQLQHAFARPRRGQLQQPRGDHGAALLGV